MGLSCICWSEIPHIILLAFIILNVTVFVLSQEISFMPLYDECRKGHNYEIVMHATVLVRLTKLKRMSVVECQWWSCFNVL